MVSVGTAVWSTGSLKKKKKRQKRKEEIHIISKNKDSLNSQGVCRKMDVTVKSGPRRLVAILQCEPHSGRVWSTTLTNLVRTCCITTLDFYRSSSWKLSLKTSIYGWRKKHEDMQSSYFTLAVRIRKLTLSRGNCTSGWKAGFPACGLSFHMLRVWL